MQVQCLKCKGRGYCGRSFCAIIAKSNSMFKVKEKATKEDFLGSTPAPFIGHHGYPFLNVGVLSIPEIKENAWEYDAPRYWADNNFQIPKIIDFRSSLINSRFKAHAHDRNKLLELSQEVGMSSKPVDIEINLADKPKFRLNTSAEIAPMGPHAVLKKAILTSNPHIDTRVDKVVGDHDLKSTDAMLYLYDKGFDENFLTKILSVGTLGIKKNRHLVPTRWSITATDDTIGKNLIEELKDYSSADYQAYFGSYLGNYYLILLFPEKWSYELFEMYRPNTSWNVSDDIDFTTDYENYDGRKSYAENCAGGYYAARLPILEKLKSMKRQASVLTLRFITGEYAVPLGVWVVREATRKAMSGKPIEFSDRELMLNYAKALFKKNFGCDISNILKQSQMLKEIRDQTKLSAFFN